ncbi:hypothetical protein CP532_4273 [Ophiocordyceps camponoti-leonardi (nom. inval.)]|nr:hypothetical protein CP532_4273 [Ophiocordyceps camponoti-leonardi (nom. inval.)]
MTRVSVYASALAAFVAATAMLVASIATPNWISYSVTTAKGDQIGKNIGLHKSCSNLDFPPQCHEYPTGEMCENGSRYFCSLWRTVGFMASLATILCLACLTCFLVVMRGGKYKRETGWPFVAGMLSVVAVVELVLISMVAYLFDHDVLSFTMLPTLHRAISILPRIVSFRTMSSSSNASVLQQSVKLACIQQHVNSDKDSNLRRASQLVSQAASAGAKIVVLPECFNSPYGCGNFPRFAETLLPSPPPREQSPSFHALSAMASENRVFLVGGSIPERDAEVDGRFYNTCLTFGPDGGLLDAFRKIHLFDIDIPGKITFRESDVLSPGNKISLVRLEGYGTLAVAICYDIRFPELAAIAARKGGAFALVYPGSFNLTTGPLHWELLARSRAVDNQIYVAMCSPARDMTAGYHSWGHSMIVDPMARILAEAEEGEDVIFSDLSDELIVETRRNIPLASQRRFDVYPDVSKGGDDTV